MEKKYVCPNCGAESKTGGICEYCGGTLTGIDTNATSKLLVNVKELYTTGTKYVSIIRDSHKAETIFQCKKYYTDWIGTKRFQIRFSRIVEDCGNAYMLIHVDLQEKHKAGPTDFTLRNAELYFTASKSYYIGEVIDGNLDFDYEYDVYGHEKVSTDGHWRLVTEKQWAVFKLPDHALRKLESGSVTMNFKDKRKRKEHTFKEDFLTEYVRQFYNGAYDRAAYQEQIDKYEKRIEAATKQLKEQKELRAQQKERRAQQKAYSQQVKEQKKIRQQGEGSGCVVTLLFLLCMARLFVGLRLKG